MTDKEIIVNLITQELRYNNLYFKLQALDMAPEDCQFSVLDVLPTLLSKELGISPYKMTDKFCNVYVDFIDDVAKKLPNLTHEKELQPLAKSCYHLVKSCIESEIKEREELLD